MQTIPREEVQPQAVHALLRWYGKNKRDWPWRKTKDPYAIWVAEIMLQQTQLKTVLPYYRRFLKQFPTVFDLARSPLQKVLKAWEGLGYYARARNLHRAAKQVVQKEVQPRVVTVYRPPSVIARSTATKQSPSAGLLRFARNDSRNGMGGKQVPQVNPWPRTAREWENLPGVGTYTAAAVASIAWGEPVPVLDGNVKRVLARLLKIQKPVNHGRVEKTLHEVLGQAIPSKNPGDFNQAWMELGQRICLPKNPHCGLCPVRPWCWACRAGIQKDLPVKRVPKTRPHYDIGVAVIFRKRAPSLLITRRPEKGLLGGLWEFPGGKKEKGETLKQCVRREIQEELDIRIEVGTPLVTVEHQYSHFAVTLHAYLCQFRAGQPRALGCDAWRWVQLDQLSQYPFPAANIQIIRALQKYIKAH